jgi:hypothetical protein
MSWPVADTRRLLSTRVLIALDLRYDERDLDETVLALEKGDPTVSRPLACREAVRDRRLLLPAFCGLG